MIDMNDEETLQAKQAFERVAASHNVTVKHYHCDNGLFDSSIFNKNIARSNQTISFCGVNAHHQNGKAECVIRDCTDGTRTSLLHTSHRWPKAIDASLWPAALKHHVYIKNNIPTELMQV